MRRKDKKRAKQIDRPSIHRSNSEQKPSMIIHQNKGSFVAIEAVCTDSGCTVKFEPGNKCVFCACYGGVYDADTGVNVSEPPPKLLNTFKAKAQDGRVIIAKVCSENRENLRLV